MRAHIEKMRRKSFSACRHTKCKKKKQNKIRLWTVTYATQQKSKLDNMVLNCEVSNKRGKDPKQYADSRVRDSSEEERESDCPIFDKFENTIGTEGILKMTNFTPTKIETLNSRFSRHFKSLRTSGRERNVKFLTFHALFFTLTTVKSCSSWGLFWLLGLKARLYHFSAQ